MIHTTTLTLNASGAGTTSLTGYGVLKAIRLSKNGQTNNPAVTVATNYGDVTETFLSTVTLNTDATYYPGAQLTGTNGSAITGAYASPYLAGGVSITVTGGDNAGTVTVEVVVS